MNVYIKYHERIQTLNFAIVYQLLELGVPTRKRTAIISQLKSNILNSGFIIEDQLIEYFENIESGYSIRHLNTFNYGEDSFLVKINNFNSLEHIKETVLQGFHPRHSTNTPHLEYLFDYKAEENIQKYFNELHHTNELLIEDAEHHEEEVKEVRGSCMIL